LNEQELKTNLKVVNSPVKRMELGGILVYDTYAKITGSMKMMKYY
jgi:hypothetical protein